MIGNCIAPRQAGPEVLALLKDDEFLAFMSMGRLWDVSQSVAGAIQLLGNLVSPPFFEKETRSKDAAASFFLTVIWPRFQDILPYRMPSCIVQLDQHKMVCIQEVQNLRNGVRYPGLSLVEAVEQSIQNRNNWNVKPKRPRRPRISSGGKKAAEKEAKAAQKELGKRRDNTSKGSSGGTKASSHENVLGAILHFDFCKRDIRIIVRADFRLPTVMSGKMHNNLIDVTFNSVHVNSQPLHSNLAVNTILPHCLPVPLQLLDDVLRGLLVDDDLFAEARNLSLQHRDAQLVALNWLHNSHDS
ncbi:hypothetical protein B0H14DRAFT_2605526 [Mycena olivaceomarginata]|nr:hypothetical protein B0H14DRAFT_2605526 [Mycena olivaceomarginata]